MTIKEEMKKLEQLYRISDRLSYIMGRLEPAPSLEEERRLFKEAERLKIKLKKFV